ncbi:MBL fold metallo-hydrolase [Streptomyces sp. Ncost-T10-10d]|uniref:MBL fold metallo-hydrolase n=1 Tax=Streptomyces sp. Ncost-T10-10d TaxID=1839774 RepID=UPI00081E2B18|nr:MBL fold metallo-hydrolase [Streptomyces sp. Ncost-T10-10d]SCF98948.1 Metallo-beta-lactamase superfamily protein [Streptomyces sp. Ncost-T10-10d]
MRYGTVRTSKSAKYLHYTTYGEPDEPLVADFYFWLVRNGRRTVLVDSDYDDVRTRARGYLHTHHPVQLLARFGLRPEDIDHVVVSHLHFDHIGNLDHFPRAAFSVSRDEFAFWTGLRTQCPTPRRTGSPHAHELIAAFEKLDYALAPASSTVTHTPATASGRPPCAPRRPG